MILIAIFAPLISFLSVLFFGRWLGKNGTSFLTCLGLFVSLIISVGTLCELLEQGSFFLVTLSPWIFSGIFLLYWEFLFDPLSLSMLSMISLVSGLVHFYSIEYMEHDPHFNRFMFFLSLFTFFMFILVTASTYVQMFVGWEGVGLCSYLLVNFWYTRLNANYSAMKAVIVNRIGDFGLTVAIVYIYFTFLTTDFIVVALMSEMLRFAKISIFGLSISLIELIVFFIFLGTIGKSAQLGLHTWLPDAMEGPTPVSALIHAATMVTAGVFVLLRSSFLIDLSYYAAEFIAIIGASTAFFASVVGAFQVDLKKIIAYSTCSQLGYMVFACGLSNYAGAMFHLINHAFFKALLFLSAGSIIHAFSDEQDIRKMGGLSVYMPFSYMTMLIGNLALIGFPFFSGFYSKDLIVETALKQQSLVHFFCCLLGLGAAFFTAYYSTKSLLAVFLSAPRGNRTFYFYAHEPKFFMAFPLFVLSLFSLFFGELSQDIFLSFDFYKASFVSFTEQNSFLIEDFLYAYQKDYVLVSTVLGMATASLLFFLEYQFFYLVRRLTRMFYKKVWYDTFYFRFIINPLLIFAIHGTYQMIDKGLLEFFGYSGGKLLIKKVFRVIKFIQSGYIFNYAFLIVAGLAIILFIC